MIEFSCMSCGRIYRVDDSLVGKSTRCKGCEAVLKVPSAGSSASRPALQAFGGGAAPATKLAAKPVARPPLQSFGAAPASAPPPIAESSPTAPPADLYDLSDAEDALPPLRPMAPAPDEDEGSDAPARTGKGKGGKKGKRLSEPGSFSQRFAACFLDGILTLPIWVILFMVQRSAMPEFDPSDPSSQQGLQIFLATINLEFSLLVGVYYLAMEASPLRASLGKLALGLRVVEDGGRPASALLAGFRVVLRTVSYIFVLPWIISGLIVAFSSDKRALHDKFSGTMVATKR